MVNTDPRLTAIDHFSCIIEDNQFSVECTFDTMDICGYEIERPEGGSTYKPQLVWYREFAENHPYNYIWPSNARYVGNDSRQSLLI